MRILLDNFNLALRDIQINFRKCVGFFSHDFHCVNMTTDSTLFSISKQLFGRCNLFPFITLAYLVPAPKLPCSWYIYIWTVMLLSVQQ